MSCRLAVRRVIDIKRMKDEMESQTDRRLAYHSLSPIPSKRSLGIFHEAVKSFFQREFHPCLRIPRVRASATARGSRILGVNVPSGTGSLTAATEVPPFPAHPPPRNLHPPTSFRQTIDKDIGLGGQPRDKTPFLKRAACAPCATYVYTDHREGEHGRAGGGDGRGNGFHSLEAVSGNRGKRGGVEEGGGGGTG